MTKDEKQYLQDLAAFLTYATAQDDFSMAMSTLSHDVGGLIGKYECSLKQADKDCWCPRSSGFHKRILKAAAKK